MRVLARRGGRVSTMAFLSILTGLWCVCHLEHSNYIAVNNKVCPNMLACRSADDALTNRPTQSKNSAVLFGVDAGFICESQ